MQAKVDGLILGETEIIINKFLRKIPIPYSKIKSATIDEFNTLVIKLTDNDVLKDKDTLDIPFSRYDKDLFNEVKSVIDLGIKLNSKPSKENALITQEIANAITRLTVFISYQSCVDKQYVVNYITGIPQIKKPSKSSFIRIGADEITIKKGGFSSVKASLPWSSITKVSAENRTQITRSFSGGNAALGLFIAGPFGALLGGGMGNKHDDSVKFVNILYKNELNEEAVILLETKKAFEISTGLNEVRKWYILQHPELNLAQKTIQESGGLGDLEKLAELKEKGIITQKEFDQKKKQILGL